jgi:hypothetical protein
MNKDCRSRDAQLEDGAEVREGKRSEAAIVAARIVAMIAKEITEGMGKWSLRTIFVPTKIIMAARP